MKSKLRELLIVLNDGLIERERIVKIALLAVLSGENMVLVGPPGTAKSEVARRLARVIKNESSEDSSISYFEYLLTKFSTPEEIFGPLSITELKKDKFQRNIEGYLPTAQIGFLDEIFKANSSILNSLLTILNERVYHNGRQLVKTKLISLVSASNELPTGDEELQALYDRFLIRIFVDYVRDDNIINLIDIADVDFKIEESKKISVKEIKEIQLRSRTVLLSAKITDLLLQIHKEYKKEFEEDSRENISDRRFMKMIRFIKTSAATNGRDVVDVSDILLLNECMWNHHDNRIKVKNLIRRVLIKNGIIFNADEKTHKEKARNDFKGDGSKSNPYKIETLDDFVNINTKDDYDVFFEQVADIDFAHVKNWSALPRFRGKYNGNNRIIKNLVIGKYDDIDNRMENSALFIKVMKKALIENIRFQKCKSFGKNAAVLAIDYKGEARNLQFKDIVVEADENGSCFSHKFSGKAVGCSFENIKLNSSYASVFSNELKNSLVDRSYFHKISLCGKSQLAVIGNEVKKSTLKSCICEGVKMILSSSKYSIYAAIVATKVDDTSIENCHAKSFDFDFVESDSIESGIWKGVKLSGLIGSWYDRIFINMCSVDPGNVVIKEKLADEICCSRLGHKSNFGYISSQCTFKSHQLKNIFIRCHNVVDTDSPNSDRLKVSLVGPSSVSGSNVHITGCETTGMVEIDTSSDNLKNSLFTLDDIKHTTKNYYSRISGSNNYLLSTMKVEGKEIFSDDHTALFGKTIDISFFNQRYVENHLEWDFDKIWYWDEHDNIPRLQGDRESIAQIKSSGKTGSMEEADTRIDYHKQLEDNIWL